jgi:non-specific serine/threonine protein kinase
MTAMRLQDAGPILDTRAKAEYKRRLAGLHEVECFNDPGRTEAIQQESDAIAEQLAAAVGLGGRDRKTGSQAERARTAVAKRIRGSIKRIVEATPSLGSHLAAYIRTGYFCSYNPDSSCFVRWKLGS